ncbi:hypothetical protein J4434_05415 [Candidatus Woesearchaeota archaeon]|nr:hypothetical protein [Candidatus Woesearchaeota archaeon]
MKEKLMEHIEISFGKICPLRCIECANFVPQSDNYQTMSVNQLISNLNILKGIDCLPSNVAISGGELTIVPQVNDLVKICTDYFDNVLLATNGIFFHKINIELLKKIHTKVSIYPLNKELIPLFKKISAKFGIDIIYRDISWTISHKTGPHSDTKAQELYDNCNLRLHPMIYQDKLWQCCFGFPSDEIKFIKLDNKLTFQEVYDMIHYPHFVSRCKTCSYADMTPVETAGQPKNYKKIAEGLVLQEKIKLTQKYNL